MANWKLIVVLLPLLALAMQGDSRLLLQPDNPEMNQRAPDVVMCDCKPTKGIVRMEMRREWAPNGVDRFYNLKEHFPLLDYIVKATIEK